jgi:hypothetical protein
MLRRRKSHINYFYKSAYKHLTTIQRGANLATVQNEPEISAMLAQFIVKRTFNKVSVSLYVDIETKTADLMIKEDRLIRKSGEINFHEVRDVQLAEAYFSRLVDVPGADGKLGFLEYLDWCASRRIHPFENKAA